jgi:ArsR family transcriptional regulator
MSAPLQEEIDQMHAHLCGAMADPNRILMLYALSQASSNVSDLAEELGLSQPTVSRQLKVLRESGLVSSRREGHSVIYQLRDKRVIEALDTLRSVLASTLQQQGELALTAIEDRPAST